MMTSRKNGRRRGDPEEEEPKIPHSWTTGWTKGGLGKELASSEEADCPRAM